VEACEHVKNWIKMLSKESAIYSVPIKMYWFLEIAKIFKISSLQFWKPASVSLHEITSCTRINNTWWNYGGMHY